ncbi:hypothetical protein Tco_1233027 [Tanacetum coccineum]
MECNQKGSSSNVQVIPLQDHEMCVVNILNSVNATPTVKIVLNKGKQIWKPKGKLSDNSLNKTKQIWQPKGKLSVISLNKTKQVWKATGKLFANIGYQWRPTGKKFTSGKLNCGYQWRPTGNKFALGELCPLTRIPVTCTAILANQQDPNTNWGSEIPNHKFEHVFKCSGKSISLTEAEEEAVAREVHATHARIMSESEPEPTQRRQSGIAFRDSFIVSKKRSSDLSKKLKGIQTLTPAKQEAADIMKALKESKKMSKRQPRTGGSNEGTGNILGVPDESTVVSRVSSEDQTGSDSGKLHVSLAGPNPEHMDDENLKLITDERVIDDNPESHSGSLSSMKNLDSLYSTYI